MAALLGASAPEAASADNAGPPADVEARVIGREHTRQHSNIWRVITRERKRWGQMTRSQRRSERRRYARLRKRAFTRVRAATSDPAAEVGRWGTPFPVTTNYRGYGIHAMLLYTGKVLFWGYPIHQDQDGYRVKGNVTYAWLWDPAKGEGLDAVKDVTPVDSNGQVPSIYCSGMSFLPDGRVLVVGGNLTWPGDSPGYTEFAGLNIAYTFDPATEEWTELDRPAGSKGRWYPTQVLLGDGRTFVLSGLTEDAPGGVLNEDLELYEPPSADAPRGRFRLFGSALQRRVTDLYPHLFTMPDGQVLMTGPDEPDNALLDPAALSDPTVNPWTELDRQSVERIGGNAVLEPEGPAGSSTVLQIAGQPEGQDPHASTERLDLDDPVPTWEPGPELNIRRSYPNTIVLPDRTLVTIGGASKRVPYSPDARKVELLEPGAASWKVGPAQVEDRAYHGTAVLLPDGRVMSSGDDLAPTSDGTRNGASPDDTVEIYSPPYLFKGGPRPAITSGPSQIAWNEPFSVGFTKASERTVSSAVLIAPSASTHAVDMNQRLVPLEFRGSAANSLELAAPPDPNVAPPGRYMLFLLDSAGVPSVARWVYLGPRAAIQVEGEPARNVELTFRSPPPLLPGPGVRTEEWDLDNDGAYDDATGSQAARSFSRPGSYRVGLQVTTGFIVTHTSRTVVIPNASPVASFSYTPLEPKAGETIALSSASSDVESGITEAWDLDNDGLFDDATGSTAAVAFSSGGFYAIRLRVRDADGGETVEERILAVLPLPSTEPDPTPAPDPTPTPDPAPDPSPDPDPTPDPEPEPEPDPQPEPEPEPDPDPPADSKAPRVSVSVPKKASRLLVRSGRLTLTLRTNEAAFLEVRLLRESRASRRSKLVRVTTFARVRVKQNRAGKRRVVIVLSKRARKRLAGMRGTQVALSVTARDAAGNVGAAGRALRLPR